MKPLCLLISILLAFGPVLPAGAQDPKPKKDQPSEPPDPDQDARDEEVRPPSATDRGAQPSLEELSSMSEDERGRQLRSMVRDDPSRLAAYLEALEARLKEGKRLLAGESASYQALAAELQRRISDLRGGEGADGSLETLLELQDRLARLGEAAKEKDLSVLPEKQKGAGAGNEEPPAREGVRKTRSQVASVRRAVTGKDAQEGPAAPQGVAIEEDRIAMTFDGSGAASPAGERGAAGALSSSRRSFGARDAGGIHPGAERRAGPSPEFKAFADEPAAPAASGPAAKTGADYSGLARSAAESASQAWAAARKFMSGLSLPLPAGGETAAADAFQARREGLEVELLGLARSALSRSGIQDPDKLGLKQADAELEKLVAGALGSKDGRIPAARSADELKLQIESLQKQSPELAAYHLQRLQYQLALREAVATGTVRDGTRFEPWQLGFSRPSDGPVPDSLVYNAVRFQGATYRGFTQVFADGSTRFESGILSAGDSREKLTIAAKGKNEERSLIRLGADGQPQRVETVRSEGGAEVLRRTEEWGPKGHTVSESDPRTDLSRTLVLEGSGDTAVIKSVTVAKDGKPVYRESRDDGGATLETLDDNGQVVRKERQFASGPIAKTIEDLAKSVRMSVDRDGSAVLTPMKADTAWKAQYGSVDREGGFKLAKVVGRDGGVIEFLGDGLVKHSRQGVSGASYEMRLEDLQGLGGKDRNQQSWSLARRAVEALEAEERATQYPGYTRDTKEAEVRAIHNFLYDSGKLAGWVRDKYPDKAGLKLETVRFDPQGKFSLVFARPDGDRELLNARFYGNYFTKDAAGTPQSSFVLNTPIRIAPDGTPRGGQGVERPWLGYLSSDKADLLNEWLDPVKEVKDRWVRSDQETTNIDVKHWAWQGDSEKGHWASRGTSRVFSNTENIPGTSWGGKTGQFINGIPVVGWTLDKTGKTGQTLYYGVKGFSQYGIAAISGDSIYSGYANGSLARAPGLRWAAGDDHYINVLRHDGALGMVDGKAQENRVAYLKSQGITAATVPPEVWSRYLQAPYTKEERMSALAGYGDVGGAFRQAAKQSGTFGAGVYYTLSVGSDLGDIAGPMLGDPMTWATFGMSKATSLLSTEIKSMQLAVAVGKAAPGLDAALRTQKVLVGANLLTTGIFVAPMAGGMADNLAGLAEGLGNRDIDAILPNATGLLVSGTFAAGLVNNVRRDVSTYAELSRARAALAKGSLPDGGAPAVAYAFDSLGLKPEQLAGKPQAEALDLVQKAWRAKVQAERAVPDWHGNDAKAKAAASKRFGDLSNARDLLFALSLEPAPAATPSKPGAPAVPAAAEARLAELKPEHQGRSAPLSVEVPAAKPAGKPLTEGRPAAAVELLRELQGMREAIAKLPHGHADLPALRERQRTLLKEISTALEGHSDMAPPPEVRTAAPGQAPPKVTLDGEPGWMSRPELVRESLQTSIAGRLMGGGEFKFYESAQGIEGYFQPAGSASKVPFSFKDLRGAKKVDSIVRTLNDNAHKIVGGVGDGKLPPETLGRVFAHVRAEMPAAQLAEAARTGALGRISGEGVFHTIVLQGTDGFVVLGKTGVRTLPFPEPAPSASMKPGLPASGPGAPAAGPGARPSGSAEARLTDLFGWGKRPAAPETPAGTPLHEAGAARLMAEAGAAFDPASRGMDLWFGKDGSLLSVGGKPASGGLKVRVDGFRLGGDDGPLMLSAPKAEALAAIHPEARAAVEKTLRSFTDQQMIRGQFESARRNNPNLGDADLAEMQTLARMMRDADLPNPPYVDRIFYDSLGKGSPDQGIKLRVSDYKPKPGETRAQITEGRKAVLGAFLEAAKDPELAKLFDFKVTLAMDAMTGTQAGKFVTIYSKDPAAALQLARSLDRHMASRGISGGALPPEDLALGQSGMIAWRFGRFKQGALEVPDGRGGMKIQPDSRSDPFANLQFAKDLPGLAPWLELASADPRWKPAAGAGVQGRAAPAPSERPAAPPEAWLDIKERGPQKVSESAATRLQLGGEGGKALEIVSRAEFARRYPDLARRLADPSVEHLVIDPADPSRLKGLRMGETIELGRATEAGGRFELPDSVSRRHLSVTRTKDGIMVEDLGSSFGTRLRQPEAPAATRPAAAEARLQGLADKARSWLGMKTPEEKARLAALKDAEAARLVFADKVLELWLTDASDPRSASFRSRLEGVIGKDAVAEVVAGLKSETLPSRVAGTPGEARSVKGALAVHTHDGKGGAADILFNHEALQGNPGLWRVALSLHERVHNSLAKQGQRGEIAAIEAEVLAFDTFMAELKSRGFRPDLRPDKPGQPPYVPSAHERQMAELAAMIRKGDGSHIDLVQAAYDAKHGKGYTTKDPYDAARIDALQAAREARLLEAMRLVESGKAERLADLVRPQAGSVRELKTGQLMPADLEYWGREASRLGSSRQIEGVLQARAARGPVEAPGAQAGGRAEASLASLMKLAGVKLPTVEYIGQGSAGTAFKFQRPGEPPIVVKVGRNPPGTRRADAFLEESERIDRVHRDYSKNPSPGFEVMKPAQAEFSFAERAAIRDAALKAGIPPSTVREMVQDGVLVTTEFVPGETLKSYLASGGTLTAADRRTLAAGLERLNAAGWLATDISSKNLMVREAPGGGRIFTLIDTGGMQNHRPGSPEFRSGLSTQESYLRMSLQP